MSTHAFSIWPNSFEIKLFPLELYWAMTCNLFRNFPLSGTLVAVQSLSRVQLFVTPWTAASQASLSFTISWSLFKLTSIESVMPSNHLILCHPLLLLPSIFPSIKIFSNELAPCIRWPKYWNFSFSISPSNVYSGLISFQMNSLEKTLMLRKIEGRRRRG